MLTDEQLFQLTTKIKSIGLSLGFSEVGICDLDVKAEIPRLKSWLTKNYHGDMQWMKDRFELRSDPTLLFEQGLRAIVVRLDYLPPNAQFATVLGDSKLGYVSRYALGRDYHKLMRKRLQKFGEKIQADLDTLNASHNLAFRAFVDSAPVLERPLAAKAGLGWVGKHSLLINQQAGSWFFIGELLINLPLAIDNTNQTDNQNNKNKPAECGNCVACKTICPTQAIVDDYVVDARRCISYLTIEYAGVIAEELRPLMGNRIYGCDDCQLICPFNRIAPITKEVDFHPKAELHTPELLTLFNWDETTFLSKTEGSPIRRIGYQRWLRNIAIALGNSHFTVTTEADEARQNIIHALSAKKGISEVIDVHIDWAIDQLSHGHDVNPSLKKQERLVRSIKKGLPRDC